MKPSQLLLLTLVSLALPPHARAEGPDPFAAAFPLAEKAESGAGGLLAVGEISASSLGLYRYFTAVPTGKAEGARRLEEAVSMISRRRWLASLPESYRAMAEQKLALEQAIAQTRIRLALSPSVYDASKLESLLERSEALAPLAPIAPPAGFVAQILDLREDLLEEAGQDFSRRGKYMRDLLRAAERAPRREVFLGLAAGYFLVDGFARFGVLANGRAPGYNPAISAVRAEATRIENFLSHPSPAETN